MILVEMVTEIAPADDESLVNFEDFIEKHLDSDRTFSTSSVHGIFSIRIQPIVSCHVNVFF